MDNATHTLVGLLAAKAGLERLSPYATAMCLVAANAPDADVVTRIGGTWFALQHHRGITHSLVGVLAISLLLPLSFFYLDCLIARFRRTQPRIRLRGLMLACLLACATHPTLDWLNSYGVRPLLPWDARWLYGDILYIFDPWLWLLLGAVACLLTARVRWRVAVWTALALLWPLAFLLVTRRAGQAAWPFVPLALWLGGVAFVIWARRARLAARYGARLAQAALLLVVCYCGALAFIHTQAVAAASAQAAALTQQHAETVQRVAATPTFADPTAWVAIAETERASYRFEVRVPARATALASNVARFAKPSGADNTQVTRAEQDARARVFLNFARFPVVQLQRDGADALVRFADLRFTEPGRMRNSSNGFALDVRVPPAPP